MVLNALRPLIRELTREYYILCPRSFPFLTFVPEVSPCPEGVFPGFAFPTLIDLEGFFDSVSCYLADLPAFFVITDS